MLIRGAPTEMAGLAGYRNISEVALACEDITASHFARLSRAITASPTRAPPHSFLIKPDLAVQADTVDGVEKK